MSETVKRNSTREKKPPKYLQSNDEHFGNFGIHRATEVKENRSSTQEVNQVAKIFVKFANNLNDRFRDYQHDQTLQKIKNRPQNRRDIQNKKDSSKKNGEKKPNIEQSDNHNNPAKHSKDLQERAVYEALKNNSKGGVQAKSLAKGQGGNANIQSDLQYHAMLHEHIRQAYPDIRNLSQEMLMQLGIPKSLLEQQSFTVKEKKKDKKQSQAWTVHKVPQKQIKQDLKPFKRQSYHVAIAYHIHLKRIKSNANPNENEIDPTYNARKLREQTLNESTSTEKKKPKKDATQQP